MLMSQVQIPLPPPKIKTHSLLAVGFFLGLSSGVSEVLKNIDWRVQSNPATAWEFGIRATYV